MNLVLDDVKEVMKGIVSITYDMCVANHDLDENGNEATRSLGLVVARGTLLVVISPVDGSEIIANPFVNQDEEE
jgi:U6 snRNA-associated Sm-like protein LSm7